MLVREVHVSPYVLWCWLVQKMSLTDDIPHYEPDQHIAAGFELILFVMRENFRERIVRLELAETVQHMEGAISARAEFSTGDLLLQNGPAGDPSEFAQIPPGNYAVHMSESHTHDGPSTYVITLFDKREPAETNEPQGQTATAGRNALDIALTEHSTSARSAIDGPAL